MIGHEPVDLIQVSKTLRDAYERGLREGISGCSAAVRPVARSRRRGPASASAPRTQVMGADEEAGEGEPVRRPGRAPVGVAAEGLVERRRPGLFAGVGHLVGGAKLDFEAWIERIRPAVERAMAERAARVREAMRETSKTKAQGPHPAPMARRPRGKRKPRVPA